MLRAVVPSTKCIGTTWIITFTANGGDADRLVVDDSFVGGQDATVAVYDVATVASFADEPPQSTVSDEEALSGDFRLHVGTERTRPLRYDATDAKVVQELELLHGVGRGHGRLRDTPRQACIEVKITADGSRILLRRPTCKTLLLSRTASAQATR